MPRYTWGPEFSATYPDAPVVVVDTEPAKLDVELIFSHVDSVTGETHLSMPAYDPATHVQPDRVYAVLFAAGPIEETPESAVAGAQPKAFSDVPANAAGAEIVIPRPDGAVAG